jgi:undecaprenyl diphosphate synthase
MVSSRESGGPEHVAIIPDGNRRWARGRGLKLLQGYSVGIDKIIDVGLWAKMLGVKTLSVWALSTENLVGRSRHEINLLFRLYTKAVYDSKILKMLSDNHARVNVIGNLSLLPEKLRKGLLMLQEKTSRYNDLSINLLVGYGGKDDLTFALKRLCASSISQKNINSKTIESMLMTANVPDVDLIIRTSGEKRLSGLLPWQSNYSELYFSKKYWPDFNRKDLKRAIDTYKKRERRFGR